MELETKILDVNVDSIRTKLTLNGAERVKVEDQINDIYDFEDGRLLAHKGYARIRTVEDRLNNKTVYYMTTKKMVSQELFKVMDENEVIISNKEIGANILKSLGLVLKESHKKYRESYKIHDALVEIDINDPEFCPFPYIEIECTDKEKLESVVTLLGYTLEDTTSETIHEILARRNVK